MFDPSIGAPVVLNQSGFLETAATKPIGIRGVRQVECRQNDPLRRTSCEKGKGGSGGHPLSQSSLPSFNY
jgi:hypothetical protein